MEVGGSKIQGHHLLHNKFQTSLGFMTMSQKEKKEKEGKKGKKKEKEKKAQSHKSKDWPEFETQEGTDFHM